MMNSSYFLSTLPNLHFFTAQVTLYDGAVGAYLPKALSAEELEAELRAIIAEVGAASARIWAR